MISRKVRLDVEKFEVLGLQPLHHWCSTCKRMHEFELNEGSYSWYNEACGGSVLLQQLVIEGLLSEAKYHGIERQ